MSDWDFLYDMAELGYSEDMIDEAMSSGAAPWEWESIEKKENEKKINRKWEELKAMRDSGTISREEFKTRKEEMFKPLSRKPLKKK